LSPVCFSTGRGRFALQTDAAIEMIER